MVNHEPAPGNREDVVDTEVGDLGKPYRFPITSPESAASQEHEYLRAVVDSIDSSMCLLDATGRILWVNSAWRRFAADNGGDPNCCCEGSDYFSWRRMDGGEQPPALDDVAAGLREVVAGHRQQFEAEWACQSPTGTRWFRTHARAHLQAGHRRTVVSHADITTAKDFEAKRTSALQRGFEQRKMEAIGSLASGITHDFNNILTAILGNLELARMQAVPADLRELLDEIGRACERARRLVRQILSFRPGRPLERQTAALAPLIHEAIEMLRATASKQLTIDLHLDPIPPLRIDPTQLHQVLLNLFTNAAHAMECGVGRLRVELAVVDLDATHAGRTPGSRTGRHARIRVGDNGVGIAGDVLARIFDPYFTTKPAGKGHGMGLPMAQAIVHDHGGTITVHSEVGVGTTFEILLPYDPDSAPAAVVVAAR